VTRRELLALLALAACGGHVAPGPPAAAPQPLALGQAVDLVPAAGLVWLLDARLRDLFASDALIPALALVLPAARLDAFAKRHGGIDLRSVSELALAAYPDANLAVARATLDPARVEGAFAARAVTVDGRAVEGDVVRTWGTVDKAREQIAIFGREAIALEHGRFGPLRAAEYFAQGRLKRAQPALLADPLAHAAALLGDAPLRAFAPGPFAGDLAQGLGGLLAAATAVAGAATPLEREPDGALSLRFVVTGAWGQDAAAAADRLRAAFGVLAGDSLGRLLGVDRPLEPARAWGDTEALRLEVTVNALALGKGLRDATRATVEDVMRL
jgi:hypothetical protein